MANPKPLRCFEVRFKPDMNEPPPRQITVTVEAERFWVTSTGQLIFFVEDRAVRAFPRFEEVREVGLIADLLKPSAA